MSPIARTERRHRPTSDLSAAAPYRQIRCPTSQSVRVTNAELATVREAMRELHRLLDQLEHGELDKIVLTQRNQMRAVLITLDHYTELERNAA